MADSRSFTDLLQPCPFEIVATGKRDTDAMVEVWMPWIRLNPERLPDPEDLTRLSSLTHFYRAAGGDVFLAKAQNDVIGAVALRSLGSMGFELCQLVVAAPVRRTGLGQALAHRCLAYAADHFAPSLYLQLPPTSPAAVALYEKMGFLEATPPFGMDVRARTVAVMAFPLNRLVTGA